MSGYRLEEDCIKSRIFVAVIIGIQKIGQDVEFINANSIRMISQV